jgi:hypothetical protein
MPGLLPPYIVSLTVTPHVSQAMPLPLVDISELKAHTFDAAASMRNHTEKSRVSIFRDFHRR